MNEFPFQIKAAGSPQPAVLRFVGHDELQRYHRSLAPFTHETSTIIKEAVELTRLAAKRWRYYSRLEEAADSFAALQGKIRSDGKCEAAFVLVATRRDRHRDLLLGLAYCRRTWCHHLALDFLAVHPRVLSGRQRASGVGSGIVFGLVCLANALQIPRIWGEATVNSAAFYEGLLATRPIQDLFVINARAMAAIRQRQEKISRPALVG